MSHRPAQSKPAAPPPKPQPGAGQSFDQAILEDAAMPLEQLLAAQQSTPDWVMADEELLARDWLTPEEDKAWSSL